MKAKIPKREIEAVRDSEMTHAMKLSELMRKSRYSKGSSQHAVAYLRNLEAYHELTQNRIERLKVDIARAKKLSNKKRVSNLEFNLKLMTILEENILKTTNQTRKAVTKLLRKNP